MINLIIQVFKSISGFLILLIYSTFAFTFLFIVLTGTTEVPSFIAYLAISYNLSLGNFDAEDYDIIQWICISLALIVNPVVLLNLFISIISDAYDMVKTDCISADARELLDMILEVENMMFTRRNFNEKKYLQICKEYEKDTDQDEWEGKIRELQNYIEDIIATNEEDRESIIKTIKRHDREAVEQSFKFDMVLQKLRKLAN